MKKYLIILIFLFVGIFSLQAQTKRALFIGINTYFPEGAVASELRTPPPNLEGCVNDAKAVREVMQTRYGIENKYISTLYNQEASRAAIIKAIEKLTEESKKGDVVFIYYAGHGSQVNNSLSIENDKKDETIVPADAYKGEFDIRDKELAALINKLVDKGVIVTSIFDSCHSGSISRGDKEPKFRFSPRDSRDVKDPSNPEPPENRGALTISAARDKEPAKEVKDKNGDPHGGFTVALIQVLSDVTAATPVQQIFDRIEAIMQFQNLTQKPVLAGNEERRKGTLLGIDKSKLPNKLLIPVIKYEEDEVHLQAGFPSSISPKTQLVKKTDKGIIKLEITRMGGPSLSYAKVLEGDPKSIKAGDLFEVSNIVVAPEAAIKVYIYESAFSNDMLIGTVKNIAGKNYNWQNATVLNPAYQNLYYRDGKWVITYRDKDFNNLGNTVSVEVLDGKMVKDSSLLFNIPASSSLSKLLKERFNGFSNVAITTDPNEADYHLVGRWKNNKIEYAFINPLRLYESGESVSQLPLRTNFFAIDKTNGGEAGIADSLESYMLRIAKVKSWLTLASPPDDGSFPFSFALRNSNSGELITNGGEVKYHDTLGLVFTVDLDNELYWDRNKRYVYVFSIDSKGKMIRFFPRNITGENTYPILDRRTYEIRQNAPLGPKRLFRITDSTGYMNYVMLTSAEPINNLDIFEQEGVFNPEQVRGGEGLEKLLMGVGSSTRHELIAPASWSITRISVKCVPRN
jgi:hypothetical protein